MTETTELEKFHKWLNFNNLGIFNEVAWQAWKARATLASSTQRADEDAVPEGLEKSVIDFIASRGDESSESVSITLYKHLWQAIAKALASSTQPAITPDWNVTDAQAGTFERQYLVEKMSTKDALRLFLKRRDLLASSTQPSTGKVTESIWSTPRNTLPMADVTHTESRPNDYTMVVFKGTTWNTGSGEYNNAACLNKQDADDFHSAWSRYRSELESETLADLSPAIPAQPSAVVQEPVAIPEALIEALREKLGLPTVQAEPVYFIRPTGPCHEHDSSWQQASKEAFDLSPVAWRRTLYTHPPTGAVEPAQPATCPTCHESAPFTGACGTSPVDKRALCNLARQATPPPVAGDAKELSDKEIGCIWFATEPTETQSHSLVFARAVIAALTPSKQGGV